MDPSLSLDDVVKRCPFSRLTTLLSSRSGATPHDVFQSQRLGELLREARLQYDYVVVDTPPLIPFPDCRLMSKWVDGFLVVVTAHKTPRKLVEEALNAVDPSKLVGIVFNGDDRPVFGYYSYYAYGPSSNGSGLRRFGQKLRNALPWS